MGTSRLRERLRLRVPRRQPLLARQNLLADATRTTQASTLGSAPSTQELLGSCHDHLLEPLADGRLDRAASTPGRFVGSDDQLDLFGEEQEVSIARASFAIGAPVQIHAYQRLWGTSRPRDGVTENLGHPRRPDHRARDDPTRLRVQHQHLPDFLKVGDTYRSRPTGASSEWRRHYPRPGAAVRGTRPRSPSDVYFRDTRCTLPRPGPGSDTPAASACRAGAYYSREFFERPSPADVSRRCRTSTRDHAEKGGRYTYFNAVTGCP